MNFLNHDFFLKIHQLNIIKIIKKDFKKPCERYRSLSKEDEKKSYENLPEDEKQKLVENRKKYCKMRKMP